MTAELYEKSFTLSIKARQKATVGQIVNLQSVDAGRFIDLLPFLHMLWSAPVQMVVATILLWQLLGPSVLAGMNEKQK